MQRGLLFLVLLVLLLPPPSSPFAAARRKRSSSSSSAGSFKSKKRFLHLNAPEPRLQQELRTGGASEETVVVVDFNNVRGKTGFRETSASFMQLLADWAKSTGGPAARVVCVVDHGVEPGAALHRGCDHLLTAFAGPNRTADDVIATVAKSFAEEGGHDVLVFTSDRELSSRCTSWQGRRRRARPSDATATDADPKAAATPTTTGHVQVMASATMLSLLDSFQGSRAVEESSGGALEDELLEAVRLSEGGLRHYENYRDKRHFKQRRLRRRKRRLNTVEAAMNAEAGLETAPPGDSPLAPDSEGAHRDSPLAPDDLAVALAPMPFSERTWHRVLTAERLRRAVLRGGHLADGGEKDRGVPPFIAEWATTMNTKGAAAGREQRHADGQQRHGILRDHRLRHDANQRNQLERFVVADAELRSEGTESEDGTGEDGTGEAAGADDEAPAAPVVETSSAQEAEGNSSGEKVEALLRSFVASGGGGADGVDPLLETFLLWAKSDAQANAEDLEELAAMNWRGLKEALKGAAVREKRPPDYILRWHAVDSSSASNDSTGSTKEKILEAEEVYALFRGQRRKARRFLKRQRGRKSTKLLSRKDNRSRHHQQRNVPVATHEQIDTWLSHGLVLDG